MSQDRKGESSRSAGEFSAEQLKKMESASPQEISTMLAAKIASQVADSSSTN